MAIALVAARQLAMLTQCKTRVPGCAVTTGGVGMKIAVVTGAAGGMGRAIVARLLADGFQVAGNP